MNVQKIKQKSTKIQKYKYAKKMQKYKKCKNAKYKIHKKQTK